MPRRMRVGGESRLSLEGLHGKRVDGKRVGSIYAHGEKRRTRTVHFSDGTTAEKPIYDLVGDLIRSRG